ncbi:MAG TPA: acyl-CoA dehydrogenase family protein [Solimonas sp.]|nr:acyl-CoA dehydrogenase family protein [Solimonas sp.]
MNLQFSEDELKFRDEVRAWIKQAYDPELKAMMGQSKNGYLDKAGQVKWQKKLAAQSWAAPGWPTQYGGPDWTPTQRYIFQMETAAAGCPPVSPMGIAMVAYVIMEYGSEAQKQRFLPATLATDICWCQGYSEPGSGSDLASLQMSAVRDGEHYVLNGSKIWTTHAQWADWMFLLVRTRRDGRQQEGITFLLADMRTPGISIRPLPSLDGPIDGEQEVNQVFFENVRVPVENRIGEDGMGWTYAKYLLQFERGVAYGSQLKYLLAKVKRIAAQQPGEGGGKLIDDADFRRRYAELAVKVEALDATEMRFFSSVESGTAIGAMSSLFKLVGTELQQLLSELAVDALGPDALPFVQDSYAEARGRPAPVRPLADNLTAVTPLYFNYRKTSIYAGTNEVQRNILARHVIGSGGQTR